MPYDIKSNVADCQGFAVVKRGTNKVVGCHKTAGDAQKQVAALYAAEPDMFAKSLDAKGLVKMHNELHGRDLDSSTVTLHHLIVNEMRQRGMSHENVECELHKAVVLKSELVLPIEKARAILKGDKAGHAFRGNQWTKGGAGGSAGSGESAGGGTTEEDAAAMADEQEQSMNSEEGYEAINDIADEVENEFSDIDTEDLLDEDLELLEQARNSIDDVRTSLGEVDIEGSNYRLNNLYFNNAISDLELAAETLQEASSRQLRSIGRELSIKIGDLDIDAAGI